MSNTITVVTADDHPVFREGLVSILAKDKDIKLLGSAENGNDAFELITSLEPDVAIVDFSMPGMNGLQLAKKCKKAGCESGIIILTMFNDEEYIQEAIQLGVKGYLLKDSVIRDILDSIYAVAAGKVFITPHLESAMQNLDKNENKEGILAKIDLLSPSELQILKLVAANKTSQQIADELFLSIRTIQNHRMNMAQKLNLTGHHKLLEFAIAYKKLLR